MVLLITKCGDPAYLWNQWCSADNHLWGPRVPTEPMVLLKTFQGHSSCLQNQWYRSKSSVETPLISGTNDAAQNHGPPIFRTNGVVYHRLEPRISPEPLVPLKTNCRDPRVFPESVVLLKTIQEGPVRLQNEWCSSKISVRTPHVSEPMVPLKTTLGNPAYLQNQRCCSQPSVRPRVSPEPMVLLKTIRSGLDLFAGREKLPCHRAIEESEKRR